jgi:glycosyltransferase involved in cell wall biosynthesis
MKIAFCTSPLSNSHSVRGIGMYTKNLLESLKQLPDLQIQEFSNISEIKEADIIHYPFFDLFEKSLPNQKRIPTVVTIHDVIPLVYPESYPLGIKGLFNNFLQKMSLKNVAAIITDSQSSKEEIIKYLKMPENKIFPIALAPAKKFYRISDNKILEGIKVKYSLPQKFVLFTGNVNWNKNLLNLTEAAIKSNIDLVLIGKSFEEKNNLDHPEMRNFKKFLEHYSVNSKVHMLGFVEDQDLVVVTNLASALLLPSFAEGFGLPILEAQICGVPVVTSNISSMPEVAGKGAILVDPNSVENISQAISKILSDGEFRKNLIEEGFRNVKKFSWGKVAQETFEVYVKILRP